MHINPTTCIHDRAAAADHSHPYASLAWSCLFYKSFDSTFLPIMEHPQDFDDGRLECTVSSPRKESEGSKDAYVSYLITTKTNFKSFQVRVADSTTEEPLLMAAPEPRNSSPEEIHGLRVPVQHTMHRIPSCCRPSIAREAQYGLRTRRSVWSRIHRPPDVGPTSIPQAHHPPPGTAAIISPPAIPRKRSVACNHAQ